MNDQEFEQRLRESLQASVEEPDELTRAALKAARYRALDQLDARRRPWWQGGLVFASVTLAAVLAWQMQDLPQGGERVASLSEDAALIADLDLVLWLEDDGA